LLEYIFINFLKNNKKRMKKQKKFLEIKEPLKIINDFSS
jgi:hypothetical protein